MSQPGTLTTRRSSRRRPRRMRRYLGALLLVGLVVGYVVYRYVQNQNEEAEAQLQAAIAEADRLDPGWRHEQLEARRIVPTPEKNAAVLLSLAWNTGIPLLNKGTVREDLYSVSDEISQLLPCATLTEKETSTLRANLAPVLPALVHARKIASLPRGHFSLDWETDPLSIWLRSVDQGYIASWLLSIDASLFAQDGDLAAAWKNCAAMFNVARAMGDEPDSQLFRVTQLRREALRAVERVLGQGEISEALLAAAQNDLNEETNHPGLLIFLRGRRALYHRWFTCLDSGAISLVAYKEYQARLKAIEFQARGKPATGLSLRQQVQTHFSQHEVKPAHAWWLTFWTKAVEIAKRPPEEQEQALAKLQMEAADAPPLAAPDLTLLFQRPSDIFAWFKKGKASLRCAITALAVERYRLLHGDWPDSLEPLVMAKLLNQVPVDPFSGKSLRYRPTKDGVVLYSVGPDGKGNGTACDGDHITREDYRLEFRLWNPDRRGQLQKSVVNP
jgi:Tfp pilus assembly protein PilN